MSNEELKAAVQEAIDNDLFDGSSASIFCKDYDATSEFCQLCKEPSGVFTPYDCDIYLEGQMTFDDF